MKPRPGPCAVDGCPRLHSSHGYCALHVQRWRKWGEPGPVLPRWRLRVKVVNGMRV